MIDLHERLSPNKKEVAAKIMDGEVIIINLSNGTYYSMDGTGAVIWQMFEEGLSLEECVVTLLERYEISRERAQGDIERLVAELLQEKLVIMLNQEAPPQKDYELTKKQKTTYQSPKLNIYRDMGDLLALDPPMPGLEESPWKESNSEP